MNSLERAMEIGRKLKEFRDDFAAADLGEVTYGGVDVKEEGTGIVFAFIVPHTADGLVMMGHLIPWMKAEGLIDESSGEDDAPTWTISRN